MVGKRETGKEALLLSLKAIGSSIPLLQLGPDGLQDGLGTLESCPFFMIKSLKKIQLLSSQLNPVMPGT